MKLIHFHHCESIFVDICDLVNLLAMWPYSYPDYFKMRTNSISCKSIIYLANVFYSAAAWFSLLCSLDRFLSVFFSANFGFRKKFKYQVLLIGIIGIIMIIINAPFYLYFDVIGAPNDTVCGYVEDIPYIGFTMDLHGALSAVFVPFFLMILSSALIGWRLIKKKSLQQANPKKYKKDKRLIRILFSLDLFFLLCNLPSSILTIVADLYNINYFGTFLHKLVNNLTIVYNILKFFVYFVSNNLFREHFISSICCIRKTSNKSVSSM